MSEANVKNAAETGSRRRKPVDHASQSALRWRALYLMAAFGIFCADQLTKQWAVRRLRTGDDITVISGFLDFVYAENTGVAFGQLQRGGAAGRWLLALFAAVAAVGVLVYFFRTARSDDRVLGACSLLLAGILGNFADRIRLGYVIDFISVHAGGWHYPIFNIADAAICIGAGLLLIDAFWGKDQQSEIKT